MKMTVSKSLNDVSLFIAPLCDDNITLNDLSIESGFVNAYTSDINRPFLENKVFFVYDSKVNTKESLETHLKFPKLATYYNKKYMTVNKHPYTIYCLSSPKYRKDINNLQKVGKTLTLDAMLEINRFWDKIDFPEIPKRLFYSWYRFGEPITAELPEEDYYSYEDIGESL